MQVFQILTDDNGRTTLCHVMHQGVGYDLIHSTDDGGWYFQRHHDENVSKEIYKGKKAALKALSENTITWVE